MRKLTTEEFKSNFHQKFGTKYNLDNSGCFEQLGEPVFRSGNLTVYKVTPVQVY